MLFTISALLLVGQALACPDHSVDMHSRSGMLKRATATKDWSYEDPKAWATVNPAYGLCGNGTTQSPIDFARTLLSKKRTPSFKYQAALGDYFNTGEGPGFTLNSTDIKKNPSMTFDGETVYLLGFHTHTPSEHTVKGKAAAAELHLVHGTASGTPRSVVGVRIKAGAKSAFFDSFMAKTPAKGDSATVGMKIDPSAALKEVGNVKKFWTYEGSLTTPPCTQGLRWFVAADMITLDDAQMAALLEASAFSARPTNKIQQHKVNE